MKSDIKELYRTQEFASLAGVTARTLRHYDRLGLLKPRQRSRSGYRLYNERDLAVLEQIVVLKFVGMSLKQIRSLLCSEGKIADALARQQFVLAEKRKQLDKAIEAIAAAQESARAKGKPDWKLFQSVVKEIEMQNNMDWTEKYYSQEAKAKVEERRALWSPELQEKVSRQWAELFADIEASLNEDPAGSKAQALAARWKKLVGGFTGGDPEIQKGLNTMWADHANWPTQPRQDYSIKPEIQAFIITAMDAGK